MEEQVPGRGARHGEMHSERTQTAIGRQSERRVFIKHLPVEMYTDVGLHVLGAIVEHLGGRGMGQLLGGVRVIMQMKVSHTS